MKVMEPHENILNLLGHCTTPGLPLPCCGYYGNYWCSGGPLCLIVEYASYGNLRDFLRQCEEVVLSLNHMPHIPRNRCRQQMPLFHTYIPDSGHEYCLSLPPADLAPGPSLPPVAVLPNHWSPDKILSLPPAVATPNLSSPLRRATPVVGAPAVMEGGR